MKWLFWFAGAFALCLIFLFLRQMFRAWIAKQEALLAEQEAQRKREKLARCGPDYRTGAGTPEPLISLYQPPGDDMGVPINSDKPISEVNAALEQRDQIRLDKLPIGASRFGGVPDLPPNLLWPEYKGKKLPFLAQIDLMELSNSLLPSEGWLFVFGLYDPPCNKPDERTPVQVLHFSGNRADLIRSSMPDKREIWVDCRRVIYSTMPLKLSQEKDWTEAGWLFGDDFTEDYDKAAGIADDQDCSGDDWITLLVIQSVGDMCWSDCGKFHFAIRRSDLERHDFSKVCAGLSEVG